MVSQPACPFTYARGEETSLLRGGDWKEEKRREKKILEEWRQSAKEHSQNSVVREELFSDNQIVINQSYTEWNKLGC